MKALVVLLVILVLSTSASFFVGLYRYTNPKGNLLPLDQLPSLPLVTTPQPTATPIPTPEPIPDQHVIAQQLHVFQTFNNCGPASLSMQLSYFDEDVSQKTLGDSLRPYQHPTGDNDDKSVTLSELAEEASKYGLNAVHRPNGSMEKITQLIAMDLPVVIRTWLKEGEDIGHYRVIRGYDLETQTLIQDDSLQGKDLSYTFEQMESLWQPFNYEYLVLYPDEKSDNVEKIIREEMNETVAWENSRARIEQELSRNPNDIYAQFNMSVTLYHLGKYEESVEYFEAVENKLPSRMLWYQIEPLWSYYKTKNFSKLNTKINTVLENNNRAFSELYYLKGLVLLDQGNQPGARQEFEKALIYKHNFQQAQDQLNSLN